MRLPPARVALSLALPLIAVPAVAQQAPPPEEAKEDRGWRTRVGLGPQLVPDYPGADGHSVRPLVEFSRARGDEAFAFEAPDESFGIPFIRIGKLAFGPVANLEGSRRIRAIPALPKVRTSIELGGSAQIALSDAFRLRAEVRKGVSGHKGWIGTLGADYIARDGDDWLFSIGPRATFADRRYHRAYFDVSPAVATASGAPAYATSGGLQSVGVTAGYLRQLSRRWGIYSYAKYDRLVADPARSPLVRAYGSRNQLSGGLALTYTFGRNVARD